jgi:glycosyltransferase involved in cell wall biosynthesis
MRIFGSVDTFVESSGTLRLGRLVANATFLEALLRHGPYDLHEFFCPTHAERSRLEEFLRSLPDGARLLARCRLRLQLELPKALVDPAWEVMHSGGWGRYLPSLAWARARWSQRPFPLTGTIHSLDEPSMPRSLGRLVRSPLGAHDAILCTSKAGREAFSNQVSHVAQVEGCAFPARLEMAPLGVPQTAFQPPPKALARSRMGIAPEARVATWLGRISATSKADLHPLLYQWRMMREVSGGKLLVLAGGATGGDLRSLAQTIEELDLSNSVRLMPDLDDAAKADLLGASDVFVSPVDNFQETFGISVVEAMAAGLAVVASDWDGYKDLVEDGVSGFLVPTRWAPPPQDLTALRQILEPGLSQLALGQGVFLRPWTVAHGAPDAAGGSRPRFADG